MTNFPVKLNSTFLVTNRVNNKAGTVLPLGLEGLYLDSMWKDGVIQMKVYFGDIIGTFIIPNSKVEVL